MDVSKSEALKVEFAAAPEPQLVPIERFFDGNDDMGSIGCNLMEHPGMDVFSEVLTGLLNRPDVEAVYAKIAELDPGEENWPFTDTVIVVGSILLEDLREEVQVLEPDDIGSAANFGIPSSVLKSLGSRVLGIWWD